MEIAKYILALDPGRRTGWARGVPGERPESGAVVLYGKDEDARVGCGNIGAFITDIIADRIPDLVVYEAALNPYVWFDMCRKIGRPQNAESLANQHMYAGAIERECFRHSIDCIAVDRQAVLKHFTGRRSWDGGREAAKKHVIARAKILGIFPLDSKDDDRADALANLDYASALYGRKHASALTLFDQGEMRHR